MPICRPRWSIARRSRVQIVVMPGNGSLWLFWWSYFSRFPHVNGWQQSDVVIIQAISAPGSGLGAALSGNAPALAQPIMTGGPDAYPGGVPRNILLYVCISATDPAARGDSCLPAGPFSSCSVLDQGACCSFCCRVVVWPSALPHS
ncbi:MAG TPA: hypothetical protein VGF67_06010 [Ktedonobacteraceae bacterium]